MEIGNLLTKIEEGSSSVLAVLAVLTVLTVLAVLVVLAAFRAVVAPCAEDTLHARHRKALGRKADVSRQCVQLGL